MGPLSIKPAKFQGYAQYLTNFRLYSLAFPNESEQMNRTELMVAAPATVYSVSGPQGTIGYGSPHPPIIGGHYNPGGVLIVAKQPIPSPTPFSEFGALVAIGLISRSKL